MITRTRTVNSRGYELVETEHLEVKLIEVVISHDHLSVFSTLMDTWATDIKARLQDGNSPAIEAKFLSRWRVVLMDLALLHIELRIEHTAGRVVDYAELQSSLEGVLGSMSVLSTYIEAKGYWLHPDTGHKLPL